MWYKIGCIALLSVIGLYSCKINKIKNIDYITSSYVQQLTDTTLPKLDVYFSKKLSQEKKPILIFVHGGYWDGGDKDIYFFLGKNFAKRGVVTIIPGYTLSPKASYNEMAYQIAESIKWAKKHADVFHGDTNKIFLTGHSAGGHLAALAVMNPKFGIQKGDVAGIILNDVAFLDAYTYLSDNPPSEDFHHYISTWTNNPEAWKDASPIRFIQENTPPIKVYLGKKSYPGIIQYTNIFVEKLKEVQPNVELTILNKKHVPMVVQFAYPWNRRSKEIIEFMNEH